jgi:chemotaxis protein methyltransferase WspC
MRSDEEGTNRGAIEALLAERIGLDVESVSRSALDRALKEQMRRCGSSTEAEYLARLYGSAEAMTELVENLVVPETWFFRDSEPFAFLREYVTKEWRLRNRDRVLRILSIPCSTGEEPYSIAITLLEAGLEPEQFRLTALDISPRALAVARSGVYGPQAFREKDEDLRKRYFRETAEGLQILPEAARRVRMSLGNVLEPAELEIDAPYDLVFFRNLLIYLIPEARRRAVRNVDAVLKPGGLLFLGYAEPSGVFFPDFQSVAHPRSYASRKAPPAGVPQRAPLPPSACAPEKKPGSRAAEAGGRGGALRPAKSTPAAPRPAVPFRRRAPSPEIARSAETPAKAAPESDASLEKVRRLADEGRLREAEELANRLVETRASNAEAHYLLGVTALAAGREEEALERFQRAVYLNPHFMEALVHLSLLLEKRGRKQEADRCRERIRRLERAS